MSDTQTISVINLRTTPLDTWKRVMKSCGSPEEWPASSTHVCWWCCHTFETVPCFLPLRFDEHRRTFVFTGNFCSWNCVKRYAFDIQMRKSTPPPGAPFIGLLAFTTTMRCNDDASHGMGLCECSDTETTKISMSHDRECLELFGGSVSITEYRKGFLMIQKYENVRWLFQADPPSRKKLRNCTFTRVKYEGQSQIFQSVVQLLPYSSRSVVAPNNAPSKTKPKSPPRPNLRPTRAHSRQPTSSAPLRRAQPPSSSVLGVNDEQTFYTRRLNACGNILQSMGVTIQR